MEFTFRDFQVCCGVFILFAIVYPAIFVLCGKAKKDGFLNAPKPADEAETE